ncbi:hypothetical protein CR983_03245 [Candidatus Saccharibacteria bacterium]|nr:MAG: hypothetical protein CR983_03245 [Candidatus Saccharibacteria bacterium]
MTNPETLPPSPAQRLIGAIDGMFAAGTARRGDGLRQHEEALTIIPTTELSRCPEATVATLLRPIPDEADQAHERWKLFGGHRVTVSESSGQIQTDFFIGDNDEVRCRRVVTYSGDLAPRQGEGLDEAFDRQIRQLLAETIRRASDPADAAAQDRERTVGEALTSDEVEQLLEWINGAVPE